MIRSVSHRLAALSPPAGENAGCFGGKKRRDGAGGAADGTLGGGGTPSGGAGGASRRHLPLKGMELLWQPDVSAGVMVCEESGTGSGGR